MKKTNFAVIISIILHILILFTFLPLNNNFIEDEEEPYQYKIINAVLLNNQPKKVSAPVNSNAQENQTEIINREIKSEEDTVLENFIVADPDNTKDALPEQETNSQNISGSSIESSLNSDNTEYYSLSIVDTKPALIEKPDFIFPRTARRNNITEATVTVEILLSEYGEVIECTVIEEAGFGFDEAVIEMFNSAQFTPAYIGNTPVPVKVRIPVHCKLED